MSLQAVAAGLKTRLETISTLRAVFDHAPGSVSAFPAAVVLPASVAYRVTMSKTVLRSAWRVIVVTSGGSEREQQQTLLALLDATGATASIQGAVQADRTLGGAAHDAEVSQETAFGRRNVGGHEYWGAEVMVEVLHA